MHEYQIQQLKKLKYIEPDPAFLARSRRALAAFTPQVVARPWFFTPFLKLAGAVAVLLGTFGISSYLFPAAPVLSSSLNPESLRAEIQNTIAIQVKEIQYDQQTDAAIMAALDEIKDTETKHLNETILGDEMNSLGIDEEPDAEIDALLNQITE